MVQVETHLGRGTPVVARTGVRVTVQLVRSAGTVGYTVTPQEVGQTQRGRTCEVCVRTGVCPGDVVAVEDGHVDHEGQSAPHGPDEMTVTARF